jgi:hypothetical protein
MGWGAGCDTKPLISVMVQHKTRRIIIREPHLYDSPVVSSFCRGAVEEAGQKRPDKRDL